MKEKSHPLLVIVFYLLFIVAVIAAILNIHSLIFYLSNGDWTKRELYFSEAIAVHILLICLSLFQRKIVGIIVLLLSLILELFILPFWS